MAIYENRNLYQSIDSGNTTTYTDSAAQYVGSWTRTRSVGVVRQLTVLACDVTSGLGGTFIFEYSEDAATATISESRTITDFATVRDFDLINAGEYYRVKFTPDRTVTVSEFIFITTTLRRQNDGAFVRLANQEIEESNAAMGQVFAYPKAFLASTGKSVNIRANESGGLLIGSAKTATYGVAFQGAASPYALTIAITLATPSNVLNFWHTGSSTKTVKIRRIELIVASVSASANVTFRLRRTSTAPTAGTAMTPAKMDTSDATAETSMVALPTVTGTLGNVISVFPLELANSDKNKFFTIYDMDSIVPAKAPTLRAGVLEGFALIASADGTVTLTGAVNVSFTEE